MQSLRVEQQAIIPPFDQNTTLLLKRSLICTEKEKRLNPKVNRNKKLNHRCSHDIYSRDNIRVQPSNCTENYHLIPYQAFKMTSAFSPAGKISASTTSLCTKAQANRMLAMRNAFLNRSLPTRAFTGHGLGFSTQYTNSPVSRRLCQRLQILPFTAQFRGVKSSATVWLDDLSDGVLKPGKTLPELKDGPTYPTVVQQARDNMRKYENCVLLTRVGSFYEVCQPHQKSRLHR